MNFSILNDLSLDLLNYVKTTDVYLRCLAVDLPLMRFDLNFDGIQCDIFNKYKQSYILGVNFVLYKIYNQDYCCVLRGLDIDKAFIHGYYSNVIRMNLVHMNYKTLKLRIVDDKMYTEKLDILKLQNKKLFVDMLDYASVDENILDEKYQ